jgi:hypothetical protein
MRLKHLSAKRDAGCNDVGDLGVGARDQIYVIG